MNLKLCGVGGYKIRSVFETGFLTKICSVDLDTSKPSPKCATKNFRKQSVNR